MPSEVVVALIAAGAAISGGLIGPVVSRLLNRRQVAVELDSRVSDQWKEWSDELKERVRALENDRDELRRDVAQLRRELHGREQLIDQLKQQIVQYRRVIRSLIGHMKDLREYMARTGEVPEMPPEVDDAVTQFIAEPES